MNRLVRNIRVFFIILFVLIFSMFYASPAFADDAPPPTETPEVVTEVEENNDQSQVTEEADEESPAVEEIVDESQTDESASSTTTEVDTVSEIIDSAPADTEIIVLDENGEALPLATEEASEIVQEADPIWCPSTVAVPVSGGSGCSPSFTSMNSLIIWLNGNNPNQAGTIWIEKTYDSLTAVGDVGETDFTLNGATLTNMANFALTIKGGWNGIGTGSVDTTNSSRFDGASLSVINWEGNITISDIEVYNATTNPNVGAASGLYVETEGSITLTRVDASFNDGALDGAKLENDFPGKSGAVTINDSDFGFNDWGGLIINTHGTVTIKDSSFTLNQSEAGVVITNSGDATPSSVTIATSFANSNGNTVGDDGFQISSNGVVTLTDVTANNNFGSGAVIDTTANAAGTANIVLNNTNTFENNDEYGLSVLTNSSITIKHIMANANAFDNANLDNNNTNFNLLIKPITISGTGIFNGSTAGSGLKIVSNGVVTLSNITAGNNFQYGASIDTDTGIVNNSAVTLKGTNTFNNNTNDGLQISSDGNISISNVTANFNTARGVDLDNDSPSAGKTPSITVVGFLAANTNSLRGLSITSDGAITLANLTIIANATYGVFIGNDGAPTPQAVKITGTNFFGDNGYDGLEILSKGAVTLSNITASGNGSFGEYNGVQIDNALNTAIQQNVTITGVNVFSNNTLNGLLIESYGTVSVSNITADNNGEGVNNGAGDGASITNAGGVVTNKGVTLTGYEVFNNNDGNGLNIVSNGAVVTNNVTASENDNVGIVIINSSGVALPITLNGVNFFNGNGSIGAYLISDSAIKLSKVTANGNGAFGLLAASIATTAQPITILGFVTANQNTGTGIQLVGNGVVTVTNITAMNNSDIGVLINNSGATTPKAVTLTGINYFASNLEGGLWIASEGAITTNNITALDNGLSGIDGFFGVYLQNNAVPASQQPVTMNGLNVFNGNGLHGLVITSFGVVTLNNLTALDNGHFVNDGDGNGVFVDNSTAGTVAKAVVLKGTNTFNGSDERGLYIVSKGAITLSNITANDNDSHGAFLDNGTSPVNSAITITGYATVNNNLTGILIFSNGAFTATNLSANNNSATGIYADIAGVTAPQAFTLKGNNTFNANGSYGLYVLTDGNITANNLNANNNGFVGAYLDNFSNWNAPVTNFTTFGSITITGFGNFNNNLTGTGLHAETNGNVTLTRVTANYNGTGAGDDGIYIDANGNVTLTCAIVIDNFEDGLQAIVGGNLTIKGLFFSLNGDNEDYAVTGTTTKTTCP